MESEDDWQLADRIRAGSRSAKSDPFAAAVRATRMAMIITDPRRLDNPIIFANDAFLDLTGYSRMEITGRNCRFLQGPDTDLASVARVREAIRTERDVHAELLNYRKDGSTFHNALFISPVHDENGTLLFFFASQLDVSDRHAVAAERDKTRAALEANALLLREMGHRARNDLQMIAAMLALQSSSSAEPAVREALTTAIARVDALAALYRSSSAPDMNAEQDLAALTREIAGTLVEASGRRDITLLFDLAPVPLRTDAAAPLALILNEVVTNALKHAFTGRAGCLSLCIARQGAEVRIEISDDGVGRAEASADAFGQSLVEALTRQLEGRRTVTDADGTCVAFRFPLARLGP